jgi:hypothetical protein
MGDHSKFASVRMMGGERHDPRNHCIGSFDWFVFYSSGIHSFRELDNALRVIEVKLTVMMEALQP